MVSKKRFNFINEIQEIQRLAQECNCDVGLHSLDSSIIIDAKSYIGMYALDFTQPILIVSEDEKFHAQIAGIGQDV